MGVFWSELRMATWTVGEVVEMRLEEHLGRKSPAKEPSLYPTGAGEPRRLLSRRVRIR